MIKKPFFGNSFPNKPFPDIDLNQSILELLFSTADLCLEQNAGVNLELKVVLSMANRIYAEKYIIGKNRGVESSYDCSLKMTGQLVQDFKVRYSNHADEITVMKRINLIAPSNIHINVFMYEPTLEIGFYELKGLYREVKSKLN